MPLVFLNGRTVLHDAVLRSRTRRGRWRWASARSHRRGTSSSAALTSSGLWETRSPAQHNHSHESAHTHTHTHTLAYIHLVPPHRWRCHRYGRQPSLPRRAEATAICCGHGGSGCDQVGGRAGVSVRQNQSIACNVLVSLNDGIDYFTLKQTFVTLARHMPKLRTPPRLALPASNCMAHRPERPAVRLGERQGPALVRWQLCIWRCAVQIAYKALHVISMSRLYGFVSGNVPNELHGTSPSHVLGMTARRCIASWIMSARPLPLAPTLLPQVRAHQPVRRVCRHQGAWLVSEEQPCPQAPHPLNPSIPCRAHAVAAPSEGLGLCDQPPAPSHTRLGLVGVGGRARHSRAGRGGHAADAVIHRPAGARDLPPALLA